VDFQASLNSRAEERKKKRSEFEQKVREQQEAKRKQMEEMELKAAEEQKAAQKALIKQKQLEREEAEKVLTLEILLEILLQPCSRRSQMKVYKKYTMMM
jgi:hypothetical protein